MPRNSTADVGTSESGKTHADRHPHQQNPPLHQLKTSRPILNENSDEQLRNWIKKDTLRRLLSSRSLYPQNNRPKLKTTDLRFNPMKTELLNFGENPKPPNKMHLV